MDFTKKMVDIKYIKKQSKRVYDEQIEKKIEYFQERQPLKYIGGRMIIYGLNTAFLVLLVLARFGANNVYTRLLFVSWHDSKKYVIERYQNSYLPTSEKAYERVSMFEQL